MENSIHILLIDDNPDDRALFIRELRREFQTVEAKEIGEVQAFERALESGGFDVVVTDCHLRWSDGLAVLRAVKARWPDCPVIMFTGTRNEEIALEAMKFGLDDYVLKSPKHYVRIPLAARLSLERRRQRQAAKEAEMRYRNLFDRVPVGLYRITPGGVIVDANPALAQTLGYAEREELMAMNAQELFVSAEERERAEAILGSEGLIRNFETQLRRPDGAVIWVQIDARAVRDPGGRLLYYEGSLEDISERKREEAAMAREAEELRSLSLIDELTGLHNRRGFLLLAKKIMMSNNKEGKDSLLVFIDLDGLKQINDTFGHQEGDLALIGAAEILRKTFRDSDIIARRGGDEFVVLAIAASNGSADAITTRLQENLNDYNARKSRPFKLSLSVGVARFDPTNMTSIEDLMSKADKALYEDKRSKHGA